MFPMEDQPFPFQMHYIMTRYIRVEQWVFAFTLKSNPANVILCLSSPGRMVICRVCLTHVWSKCGLCM